MDIPEHRIDDFWDRVDKGGEDECWEWQGNCSRHGYGWFRFDGEEYYTHRISCWLNSEEFDNEKHVLHECDNPPCVNPKHLRQGTQRENVYDAIEKGRMKGLDPETVEEMRVLYQENKNMNSSDVGRKVGVHVARARAAISGLTYETYGGPIADSLSSSGSRNCNAKLSKDDVLEIRELAEEGTPDKELAEIFGVTEANVNYIINGDTWTHVGGPIQEKREHSPRLTEEEALEVRFLDKYSDMSQEEIGNRVGTSSSAVSKIVTYTNFPDLNIR